MGTSGAFSMLQGVIVAGCCFCVMRLVPKSVPSVGLASVSKDLNDYLSQDGWLAKRLPRALPLFNIALHRGCRTSSCDAGTCSRTRTC